MTWPRPAHALDDGIPVHVEGQTLNPMLKKSPSIYRFTIVLIVSAVVTIVLFGFYKWIPGTTLAPPALKVRTEAADVFDDSGEMYLITLGISNVNSNGVFIKNLGVAIQAKVGNVWAPIDADFKLSEVYHGWQEKQCLFPSTATSCRISLQYTGAHPTFKGNRTKQYVYWVFGRLPDRVQSKISRRLLPWLGWPTPYLPNGNWRPVVIEMPVPSSQS